ncbi:MAG: inorganic phosphate transporter [Bacteroidales bacterium]|jgi:PiT family inorganic phosphate transporter|nr:inorganic phosphate transporter [Bacteroidales bacterium]MDX9906404.1 inorganic phosphate transporter [Bacteroidales bacterium]
MLSVVIIAIVIALLFDFLNGMNDAANSIATVVSTKVLPPLVAVVWAAFFNFAAVFFFGVHVATTIGKGIVEPAIINEFVILAALIGSVVWVYVCTNLGLPISVSHALIGGLIGPALVIGGKSVLVSSGIIKVALFIVLSPLIGLILGYFLMILTMLAFHWTSPRKVDHLFRGLQLVSSAIFSIGHGTNDAQKTMGIISVLLFSTGRLGPEFHVPTWVIIASYSAISLGTLAGGWKVIKTLGLNLTALKPVHGFCAETAGAITIIGSSLAGIPVSTTHTITGSIMGVGMTRRLSAVRWGVVGKIVMAWVFTIPGTIVLSAGLYYIISLFLNN